MRVVFVFGKHLTFSICASHNRVTISDSKFGFLLVNSGVELINHLLILRCQCSGHHTSIRGLELVTISWHYWLIHCQKTLRNSVARKVIGFIIKLWSYTQTISHFIHLIWTHWSRTKHWTLSRAHGHFSFSDHGSLLFLSFFVFQLVFLSFFNFQILHGNQLLFNEFLSFAHIHTIVVSFTKLDSFLI